MAQPARRPLVDADPWPALPLEAWKDTYATLHMWTQIVGKIRLALSPPMNHWWHAALYLTARGLTTSPIPGGTHVFEIRFDFIDHTLVVERSDGAVRTLALTPRTVADFYAEVMGALRSLGIAVSIFPVPSEVAGAIPFDRDRTHAAYDPEFAYRHWRVLLSADRVLKEFRARFVGKSSPVHFFWGSFDLALTRFSGRRAPERPAADAITREAYSHEVISAGFWPGGDGVPGAAFYCYAAPEPSGFAREPIRPRAAFYHDGLSQFLLMYDDVRRADSPEAALLEFVQSTYEAGARLGGWNRGELERDQPPPGDARR